MLVAGKRGKGAAVIPAGVGDMAVYATKKLPNPSLRIDYYSGFPKDGWGMYGNDQYGDCTMAARAHMEMAWAVEVGYKETYPTEDQVLTDYFTLSGGADTGLVEADVLQWWKGKGFEGNKIGLYVPVSIKDVTQIRQGIELFGGLYAGAELPANAEDQFSNEQAWHITPNQGQPVGGHAFPLLGYNKDYLWCITWGQVQMISWSWWSVYGSELWAIMPQEFLAEKHGPVKLFNTVALEAALPLLSTAA